MIRSPSWNRLLIASCSCARRFASPRIAAIAQRRLAPRNRANLLSVIGVFPPRSGADPIGLERLGSQQLLDALGCGGLIDPLDSGKFSNQTVKRRLIDLSLAV